MPPSAPVILITGAGRGLGRTLALALARPGARLALQDLTPINLDAVVAAARRAGAECRDYIFDLAKKLPVDALAAAVLADWGRVDVLINAAVVSPQAELLTIDEWDWRRTLDVNLNGPLFTLQAFGAGMLARGAGVVINLLPEDGAPGRGAAEVGRAGLLALSRRAAAELGPGGLRVYAVQVAAQPSTATVTAILALLDPAAAPADPLLDLRP
jgi:NAD(P)-dependent dehydrogenase (short-subunit alcohol dehydrogenase family)